MGFLVALLVAVVVAVAVSQVALEQTELTQPRPLGKGDFDFPTAEASRSIPYVAGRVLNESPNIFFFDRFNFIDVEEDDIFTDSNRPAAGFSYRARIAFTLCYGPEVTIFGIRSGDYNAYTISAGVTSGLPGVTTPETLSVLRETLYEKDHGAGIYVTFSFYGGNNTQLADLGLRQGTIENTPAFRNVAYMVSDAFAFWGTSGRIEPLAFDMARYPNPAFNTGTYHKIGVDEFDVDPQDANPAYMIYEISVNKLFGCGINNTLIDEVSFQTSAVTLASEFFGLSVLIDRKGTGQNLIDEILKHIDGVLETNPYTGQIGLRLLRNDYDVNTIPAFDDADIQRVHEYGQGSLDEANTEFKLSYTNRAQNYTTQIAHAYNSAAFYALQRNTSVEVSYQMIYNARLAQTIAWRELRVVSFSPSAISLTITRAAYNVRRGDVIRINYTPLGIVDLLVRVKSVNYGDALSADIIIDGSEDVYAIGNPIFGLDSTAYNPVDPTLPDVDIVPDLPVEVPGDPIINFFIETPEYFNVRNHPSGYNQDFIEGGMHIFPVITTQISTEFRQFQMAINGVLPANTFEFFYYRDRHITETVWAYDAVALDVPKIFSLFTSLIGDTSIYQQRVVQGPGAVCTPLTSGRFTGRCVFYGFQPKRSGRLQVNYTVSDEADKYADDKFNSTNIFLVYRDKSDEYEFVFAANIAVDPATIGSPFYGRNGNPIPPAGQMINMTNMQRGLFDTIPRQWEADTRMVIINADGSNGDYSNIFLDHNVVQDLGIFQRNQDPDPELTTLPYTPTLRHLRPNPPKGVVVTANGGAWVARPPGLFVAPPTLTFTNVDVTAQYSDRETFTSYSQIMATFSRTGDSVVIELVDVDTDTIVKTWKRGLGLTPSTTAILEVFNSTSPGTNNYDFSSVVVSGGGFNAELHVYAENLSENIGEAAKSKRSANTWVFPFVLAIA